MNGTCFMTPTSQWGEWRITATATQPSITTVPCGCCCGDGNRTRSIIYGPQCEIKMHSPLFLNFLMILRWWQLEHSTKCRALLSLGPCMTVQVKPALGVRKNFRGDALRRKNLQRQMSPADEQEEQFRERKRHVYRHGGVGDALYLANWRKVMKVSICKLGGRETRKDKGAESPSIQVLSHHLRAT